jgi:hypothetical protein
MWAITALALIIIAHFFYRTRRSHRVSSQQLKATDNYRLTEYDLIEIGQNREDLLSEICCS